MPARKTYRSREEGKVRSNRDKQLKYRYGITLEQYEAMYVEQKGKCAICGNFQEKLFVDHDHETDEVRDLLCRGCNTALGFVEEDTEILLRMVDYIERHGARQKRAA